MSSSILYWTVEEQSRGFPVPGLLLLSGRAPVPPWSFVDILPCLNLYFSCCLRRLQLSYSVSSSQKESNKRTAWSLACPSVLWINILTSPLWKRGKNISLLLPSPAERCVSLGQGLPLAETDLCLAPISSRYHSDICNSLILAKWHWPIHRLCTLR